MTARVLAEPKQGVLHPRRSPRHGRAQRRHHLDDAAEALRNSRESPEEQPLRPQRPRTGWGYRCGGSCFGLCDLSQFECCLAPTRFIAWPSARSPEPQAPWPSISSGSVRARRKGNEEGFAKWEVVRDLQSWAAGYALAFPRRPVWAGPALGAALWSSDYVTLPFAGVYKPIWRYDARTLAKDLSAHLFFGTVTDVVLRIVEDRPGAR